MGEGVEGKLTIGSLNDLEKINFPRIVCVGQSVNGAGYDLWCHLHNFEPVQVEQLAEIASHLGDALITFVLSFGQSDRLACVILSRGDCFALDLDFPLDADVDPEHRRSTSQFVCDIIVIAVSESPADFLDIEVSNAFLTSELGVDLKEGSVVQVLEIGEIDRSALNCNFGIPGKLRDLNRVLEHGRSEDEDLLDFAHVGNVVSVALRNLFCDLHRQEASQSVFLP